MTVNRPAINLIGRSAFEGLVVMREDKKAIFKIPLTGSADHFE